MFYSKWFEGSAGCQFTSMIIQSTPLFGHFYRVTKHIYFDNHVIYSIEFRKNNIRALFTKMQTTTNGNIPITFKINGKSTHLYKQYPHITETTSGQILFPFFIILLTNGSKN